MYQLAPGTQFYKTAIRKLIKDIVSFERETGLSQSYHSVHYTIEIAQKDRPAVPGCCPVRMLWHAPF